MIYAKKITVPANTPEESKQKTVIRVTSGIITQIDITIPTGHQGLTGICLNRGKNQIWPSNTDNYFEGDDDKISFKDNYKILKAPYQIEVYTYNLDDTYDHSFYVRIGLTREEEKKA